VNGRIFLLDLQSIEQGDSFAEIHVHSSNDSVMGEGILKRPESA
jgi:hypothetical protein